MLSASRLSCSAPLPEPLAPQRRLNPVAAASASFRSSCAVAMRAGRPFRQAAATGLRTVPLPAPSRSVAFPCINTTKLSRLDPLADARAARLADALDQQLTGSARRAIERRSGLAPLNERAPQLNRAFRRRLFLLELFRAAAVGSMLQCSIGARSRHSYRAAACRTWTVPALFLSRACERQPLSRVGRPHRGPSTWVELHGNDSTVHSNQSGQSDGAFRSAP